MEDNTANANTNAASTDNVQVFEVTNRTYTPSISYFMENRQNRERKWMSSSKIPKPLLNSFKDSFPFTGPVSPNPTGDSLVELFRISKYEEVVSQVFENLKKLSGDAQELQRSPAYSNLNLLYRSEATSFTGPFDTDHYRLVERRIKVNTTYTLENPDSMESITKHEIEVNEALKEPYEKRKIESLAPQAQTVHYAHTRIMNQLISLNEFSSEMLQAKENRN